MCVKIVSNISKTRASCFIGVSNTRKLMKARGCRPSAFIVFEEKYVASAIPR